jgi:hypothetical protein
VLYSTSLIYATQAISCLLYSAFYSVLCTLHVPGCSSIIACAAASRLDALFGLPDKLQHEYHSYILPIKHYNTQDQKMVHIKSRTDAHTDPHTDESRTDSRDHAMTNKSLACSPCSRHCCAKPRYRHCKLYGELATGRPPAVPPLLPPAPKSLLLLTATPLSCPCRSCASYTLAFATHAREPVCVGRGAARGGGGGGQLTLASSNRWVLCWPANSSVSELKHGLFRSGGSSRGSLKLIIIIIIMVEACSPPATTTTTYYYYYSTDL